MTESKRPLKVFLCHAHADRDAVRALYTRLTNDGVDAWLDKEKLLGGQNWRMEIRTAVEEADVVIVCHSKEFNKEGFRQREVKWALDVAMEKPEGEIFIIPVRLEECEILENLKKWHWVDLFGSNGYKKLMQSLEFRAASIKDVNLKRNMLRREDIDPEMHISQTPIVDGLNWEYADGSEVFNNRLKEAFPGLRHIERFNREEAIKRLEVLLKAPLTAILSDGMSQNSPIWWARGWDSVQIEKFRLIDSFHVLLDIYELNIDYIVSVRQFRDRRKNFVYVQTLPDAPTGLYASSKNGLQETLDFQSETKQGYFVQESYGVWENRLINYAELDDGATVIDGKPMAIPGAELRERYITPYNLILCGQDHVLLTNEVEDDTLELFDDILLGTKKVDDLIEYVGSLKHQRIT